MGITDVNVITMEGVAFGPVAAEKVEKAALATVDAIAP
jgi:FMN-dependent NADH-azoreductase